MIDDVLSEFAQVKSRVDRLGQSHKWALEGLRLANDAIALASETMHGGLNAQKWDQVTARFHAAVQTMRFAIEGVATDDPPTTGIGALLSTCPHGKAVGECSEAECKTRATYIGHVSFTNDGGVRPAPAIAGRAFLHDQVAVSVIDDADTPDFDALGEARARARERLSKTVCTHGSTVLECGFESCIRRRSQALVVYQPPDTDRDLEAEVSEAGKLLPVHGALAAMIEKPDADEIDIGDALEALQLPRDLSGRDLTMPIANALLEVRNGVAPELAAARYNLPWVD